MKQTVTDLNDPSEHVVYFSSHIECYTFDTFFRNLLADSSPVESIENKYEIVKYTIVPFSGSIVHNVYNVNTNFRLDSDSWSLFFDGYKSKEGFGVGFVLIDPKGTKIMISYRLEFECTNNIVEYEALVQGLRKEIDIGAQVI